MPDITVEIEVKCKCGNPVTATEAKSGSLVLTVEPCTDCITAAENTGYAKGLDADLEEDRTHD